jgi:hypothetical protein
MNYSPHNLTEDEIYNMTHIAFSSYFQRHDVGWILTDSVNFMKAFLTKEGKIRRERREDVIDLLFKEYRITEIEQFFDIVENNKIFGAYYIPNEEDPEEYRGMKGYIKLVGETIEDDEYASLKVAYQRICDFAKSDSLDLDSIREPYRKLSSFKLSPFIN